MTWGTKDTREVRGWFWCEIGQDAQSEKICKGQIWKELVEFEEIEETAATKFWYLLYLLVHVKMQLDRDLADLAQGNFSILKRDATALVDLVMHFLHYERK